MPDGQQQYTDAQLADGTTLRFQGQLSPDQVKQKVQAYRANKASTVSRARGSDSGLGIDYDQAKSGLSKLSDTLSGSDDDWLHSGAQRVVDTVKGIGQTFDPRQSFSALTSGDLAGAIANTPIYRLAHGAVESEKEIAPQFVQQAREALTPAGDPMISALRTGRALTTGASMIDPFATPSVANVNRLQAAGQPKSAAASGLVDALALAAGAKSPAAAETAGIALRPGLTDSVHRILSDSATKTKQLFGEGGTIHRNVSNHFEQLSNDVAAADYADTAKTGKKIDTSPIWDKITQYSDDYAASKTTPNFNAIADAIQNRPVNMTWKELHDLSKEVGSRWEKAKAGTRDEAAASGALSDIRNMLDQRAAEVGRADQWGAAKTIWRTLKEYQGDGALNKLMNPIVDPLAPGSVSEGGKPFFDALRDPANHAKLSEVNKALEPYGAPANYFDDLAKSHAPLHNMVAGTAAGGGMFGRTKAALRAIKENPAVGIPAVGAGMVVGSAAGGPVGGTLGAIGALKGVERLSAANAIRKLGGIPADVNPMGAASQVRPVGPGTKSTPPDQTPPVAKQKPLSPKAAPVPTVNEEEVTSALVNQGYPKKTARSMAQSAIQDNPHDFDAALRQALGGKTPEAAKASEIQQVKQPETGVSGRTQTERRQQPRSASDNPMYSAQRTIKQAGLEAEPAGFNRELGTQVFYDPSQPNIKAIMKIEDIQSGGAEAVKKAMAKRLAEKRGGSGK